MTLEALYFPGFEDASLPHFPLWAPLYLFFLALNAGLSQVLTLGCSLYSPRDLMLILASVITFFHPIQSITKSCPFLSCLEFDCFSLPIPSP